MVDSSILPVFYNLNRSTQFYWLSKLFLHKKITSTGVFGKFSPRPSDLVCRSNLRSTWIEFEEDILRNFRMFLLSNNVRQKPFRHQKCVAFYLLTRCLLNKKSFASIFRKLMLTKYFIPRQRKRSPQEIYVLQQIYEAPETFFQENLTSKLNQNDLGRVCVGLNKTWKRWLRTTLTR